MNSTDPVIDSSPLDVAGCVRWLESRREVDPDSLTRGKITVDILRSLGMNETGCLAALLHCVGNEDMLMDTVLQQCGDDEVVSLYQGANKLARLSALTRNTDDSVDPEVNEDNLRKMLITMVEDVRVVLIKLAEQLCQLRNARSLSDEERRALCRSTFDIFAPLANRLGVWQLKWEMEDMALRYSEPEAYHQLAGMLNEKRDDRERYIQELIGVLQESLTGSGVEAEIHGRPKHIYSIWKKMHRKGLTFENLWDIRAVRIIVNSVGDCYAALGAVHTEWRHLPGEFDDYIATPKPNGYRSIHTVVIGPQDKSVEVQIRTSEMHQENELGVAAHWRYKENRQRDEDIDHKVLWLRQLLEWKQELEESESAAGALREAGENRRVYVFTPRGTVIDLPDGATPVDFAYAIHSEVGHTTRGARVNGRMVPLHRRLDTGDQVQILTHKGAAPSRDWLRPELGIVHTQRARSRIQQWFRQADHAEHVAEGRNMLEKELSRLGLDDLSYERIADQTPYNRPDDLLAALGSGNYRLSRALLPFRRELEQQDEPETQSRVRPPVQRTGEFSVNGVGNLLTTMAKCCQPVPGEPIVGYISSGRGVIIHKQDCANVQDLPEEKHNRLIEVDWGRVDSDSYPVAVRISAFHRTGILHDISMVLKEGQIDVLKVNTETDEENMINVMLQLEVRGINSLSKTLGRLSKLQNVLDVRRLQH